jgi:hypothetical protein
MSANHSAIRAYLQTLEDFIAYAREEGEARKSGRDLSSFNERREVLLAHLRERRRPALVAGVRVGYPVKDMNSLLEECLSACFEHRRKVKKYAAAPIEGVFDPARVFLAASLVRQMEVLRDLVELAREGCDAGSAMAHLGEGTEAPEALTKDAATQKAQVPTTGGPALDQLRPTAKAIAFMLDRVKQTGKLPQIKDILQAIPDARKATLYRDPDFRAARKALKEQALDIRHGHKTSEGDLEAEDA